MKVLRKYHFSNSIKIFIRLVLTIAVFIINKINEKYHGYWSQKSIRYVRPWPFFGFMFERIFRFKSYADVIHDLYKTFPEQRYFGCYRYLTPVLVVRDPDLIKYIVEDSRTPLKKENLNWAKVATTINDKTEDIFVTAKEVMKQFVTHYLDQDIFEVDMKEVTMKITSDILASMVFDKRLNSFKDPDNKFYMETRKNLKRKPISRSRITTRFFVRLKFLQSKDADPIDVSFYQNLLREKKKTGSLFTEELKQFFEEIKKDFVKNKQVTMHHTSNDDITAQDLLNLFAKYQSISVSICYLIQELVKNNNVQNEVVREINKIKEKHDNQITLYDVFDEMPYLDSVILEHLRKRPFAAIDETRLNRSLIIQAKKVWEKAVVFESDLPIILPIHEIHHDRNIFPQPEEFDPSRFCGENKSMVKPYSYIPFGVLPDDCIGPSFVIIQLKIFMFYLLENFVIVQTEELNNQAKDYGNILENKTFRVILKHRNVK